MSHQRNPKKIDRLVESLPTRTFAGLVDRALAEDLATPKPTPEADRTTHWIVPQQTRVRARILARQQGVVAGLEVARAVFAKLDPDLAFETEVAEGSPVGAGSTLIRLEGCARALLTGERTALNFLQHLSGIATLTRKFVGAIDGTSARVTDTRKTIPGLRQLEKYAVRLGGGINHRMGLYDAVLIKENHAALVGGPGKAVERAHQAAARHQQEGGIRIFVETRNLDEVRSVLAGQPDRIMLDNMAPATMRQAVQFIRQSAPHIEIEATGGITMDNVRPIARTGVDLISIGALTHSAPALDLSLLFDGG